MIQNTKCNKMSFWLFFELWLGDNSPNESDKTCRYLYASTQWELGLWPFNSKTQPVHLCPNTNHTRRSGIKNPSVHITYIIKTSRMEIHNVYAWQKNIMQTATRKMRHITQLITSVKVLKISVTSNLFHQTSSVIIIIITVIITEEFSMVWTINIIPRITQTHRPKIQI